MSNEKNIGMEIQIDDGSERVPIKNKFGDEIGVFYFRPTDLGMIGRYNEVINRLEEVTTPLDKIGVTVDGEAEDPDDQTSVEALKEAEEKLYELCDYMFGGNMSTAFFGKMNPFSPVGDKFYCEKAIDAVGSFIATRFNQADELMRKKTEKYLKKKSPGKDKA